MQIYHTFIIQSFYDRYDAIIFCFCINELQLTAEDINKIWRNKTGNVDTSEIDRTSVERIL